LAASLVVKRLGHQLACWAVRNICPAATLPTNPHPLVELVKINWTREHQQPGCYEFLTSPHAASEPATGDGAGAFCSDVVTALSHLTQMLN
jgi:hypothetical protein